MDHTISYQHYQAVRDASVALAAPLSAEDCGGQSMPDASPVKWHLAHTSWFFETFILEQREAGFQPYDDAFRVLFNSYYNAVGAKHPRPQRGLLTRPALATVLDYRRDIDRRILALLRANSDGPAELQALLTLGLQHEQQHQELMLTDIKHLFWCNPLAPAYCNIEPDAELAALLNWQDFAGGLTEIGYSGEGFCFDNELPRHQVYLQPYSLASRLVSNGEFLAFIEDGGYADPRYWLAEGWDWLQAGQRSHPMYWRRDEFWQEFTLGGWAPLDLQRSLLHVSYYEADAFARWADARLPTEAEWEHAAAQYAAAALVADAEWLPQMATSGGMTQLFGDAWQWTSSSYAPYPGFRASAGAIGEYNGKFMVNQYVLRGGSCITPPGHVRGSYRNFFPASACWQYSGIRLARDK